MPGMTSLQRRTLALLGLGCAVCLLSARAQGVAKVPPAPAARAASAAQHDPGAVTLTVIEDDGVRIEETRQRGAARRIVVQSKVGGVREYEIQVAPAGRDPSQERGTAGKRTWSLFSF
jgi:hypothetical protein